MRVIKFVVLFICVCFLACGHNRSESLKTLGHALEKNYVQNQGQFKAIKQVLGAKHLKQIVLQSGESFSVSYVVKDESGRETWHEIRTFKAGTKATDDYMKLQDLPADEVLQVASAMRSVGCTRLIRHNLFDRYKGTEDRCLDLQYTEKFEGDQVQYRLFDVKKDSLSPLFSDELITADRGKIIDPYTLWYIK